MVNINNINQIRYEITSGKLSHALVRIVSFLFFLSLFFGRKENIYFFYAAFFFYVFFSVIYGFRYWRYTKISKIIIVYAIFCFVATLSTFWSVDKQLSLKMAERVLIVLTLLFITSVNIRWFKTRSVILSALIFGVCLNLIVYIFPFWPIYDTAGRFSGTLTNSNILAIITFFTIYFISRRYLDIPYHSSKEMLKYIFYIILCMIVIILTASRKGAIFGSILVLIAFIYLAYKKKRFGIVFIISSVFIIAISPLVISKITEFAVWERLIGLADFLKGEEGDSSTRWRFIYATEAFEMFKHHYVYGIGIDGFQHYMGEGHYAHNNYLEILADLGIIGFLIYYLIYGYIIKMLIINRAHLIDFAMIVIILIMEVGLVTYYERPFWLLLLLFTEGLYPNTILRHSIKIKTN